MYIIIIVITITIMCIVIVVLCIITMCTIIIAITIAIMCIIIVVLTIVIVIRFVKLTPFRKADRLCLVSMLGKQLHRKLC